MTSAPHTIHDTIAAWASAPGRSARGIIRLCGRWDTIAPMLPGAWCPGAGPAHLTLGSLRLRVLALTWRGPRSYTGEDGAEILLPGNPLLIARVLEAIAALPGVRPAGPGEFSARAYLNGKLTLAQAEGVAATIAATTQFELDAAHALALGVLGERYAAWADEVTTLLALVEAGIDFTDQEDVRAISDDALHSRSAALTAAIEDLLGSSAARRDAAPPLVALVGPPNAGKSTLFNTLLGRPRAITSPRAGTTRDALIETLDLAPWTGAGLVRLADLPGLDADPSLGLSDLAAQHHAQEVIGQADALLWCDPSGRFDPARTPHPTTRTLRVRTRADQARDAGREDLAVCALDGWNLGPLRRAIADIAAGASREAGAAALLPRHRAALLRAAHALGRIDAREPELAAQSLREAADALGELVGRISPDDVLGRVFATFCVGK